MGFVDARHLERVDLEFQSSSDDRIAAIREELWLHLDAVDTIGDLLTRFGQPTRSEFHGYAKHAQRVRPGFVALGWVPRVPQADRQAHEEACQRELGKAFMIRDWGIGESIPAPARDEYFPYCYAVPMATNSAMLGADLGSDPIRRSALEAARDEGQMTLTPGIRLAQDPGEQTGVLLVRPVFDAPELPVSRAERREKLIGFVIGACRVGEVVEKGLARLKPAGIDIFVNDVTSPDQPQELYVHASRTRSQEKRAELDRGPSAGSFFDDEWMPILNRNWRIETRPAPRFLEQRRTSHVWLFLAGGVSFTALLSLLMFSDRRRTLQILRLNSELRDSAEVLERRVEERTCDLEEQKRLLENQTRLLKDSQARLRLHNQRLVALGELRRWIDEKGDLAVALKEITRIGAGALQVERVGIWFYDETRSEIVCRHLYEHSSDRHSEGARLKTTDFPAYFAALEEAAIVSVAAAQSDPRTGELAEAYLRPLNITAMLDTPIWFRGQPKGVVCFEHIGSEREWREEEEGIACSIAELITSALDADERRRVERQLRRTQMSVDQAGIAIVWCDCDGRFIAVNEIQCEWSQYTREELLSMHVADINPEFPRSAWTEHWEDIKANGSVIMESFHQRKNGDLYPVEIFSSYVRFEGREYKLAFVHDITKRRETEADMRLKDRAMAEAQNGIAIIDARDGNKVIYCNAALNRITGYPCVELLGREMRILEGPDTNPESVARIRRALAEGTRCEANILNYRKSGEAFWNRLDISPVRNDEGGLTHFICIHSDVSEIKLAEQRIIKSRDDAQRANRAKSEFLSRMSHELRTPLNGILGFAQLLEMVDLPARARKSVDRIGTAGRHLLQLINEVLDISRVEAGGLALSPEPVRVAEVANDVITMVGPMAAERRIRIEGLKSEESDLYAAADRQRLKQVLMNLASNGIKYNREGGSLTIDCALAEADRVCISVRDTGIGITAEQHKKVFLPFERLDADQSNVEGTGLGLALTKRLVEAMKGAIGVESEPGQGSRFWVELPRAPSREVQARDEAAREAEKTPAPAAKKGAMTLLYIEDNPDNVRLVESILQHRPNVRLLTAIQGRMGIDLARQHRPDLILLDLNLPDLSGDRVLVDLKTHESTREIPVCMLSADAMAASVSRLKQMGADDYLTKPLDVPDFLERLDRIPERTDR